MHYVYYNCSRKKYLKKTEHIHVYKSINDCKCKHKLINLITWKYIRARSRLDLVLSSLQNETTKNAGQSEINFVDKYKGTKKAKKISRRNYSLTIFL